MLYLRHIVDVFHMCTFNMNRQIVKFQDMPLKDFFEYIFSSSHSSLAVEKKIERAMKNWIFNGHIKSLSRLLERP